MAKGINAEKLSAPTEKQKLEMEKKELKQQQREQRKEAKRRAREIARQEEALGEGEESNGLVTFGATILIVVLWLAVICVVIKLDVGGFGSRVLTPVLKDVPVLNRILPGQAVTETTDPDSYGGYTSLEDAVAQIRSLELQLEQAQNESQSKDEELESLRSEVLRLQEFEQPITDRVRRNIRNIMNLWTLPRRSIFTGK